MTDDFQKLAREMRESGYGRGWTEPLATSRWSRARQWLREPATKTSWTWTIAAAFLLQGVVMLALLSFWSE